MTENDAQLELKKRARRRLVGAVALATLAAIVLPMVMDQEPKPALQDIQIRIPAQDAGSFTSRILPAKPGTAPTPLPSTGVPEKPAEPGAPPQSGAAASKAEVPAAQPETAAPEAAKASAAAPSATAPGAALPAKPAEKAPPAKPEKESAKSVAKAADRAEQARAETVLNGGEQWIVQIGAYRDPANVRNLQAKLKEQGYNFYTEPLISDGVKKTRVRAGPFPSKESAEKARDKLKRIGVDGVVGPKP